MNKWCVVALASSVFLAPGGLVAQEQPGPPEIVERVEILNNRYLQKETLLFYISTKPGDRVDRERLLRDFRSLWDTGFLDDLKVEVLDGPQGKVVRFTVVERKRIQIVDYRGTKELDVSDIEEAVRGKTTSRSASTASTTRRRPGVSRG